MSSPAKFHAGGAIRFQRMRLGPNHFGEVSPATARASSATATTRPGRPSSRKGRRSRSAEATVAAVARAMLSVKCQKPAE